MGDRTAKRNQARLVRCSAGCGLLVWLAGALPVAADAEFVCPSCATGEPPVRLNDESLTPGGWAKSQ